MLDICLKSLSCVFSQEGCVLSMRTVVGSHSMQPTRTCKNMARMNGSWGWRLYALHLHQNWCLFSTPLTLGRGGTVLKSSLFSLPWYILLIPSLSLSLSIHIYIYVYGRISQSDYIMGNIFPTTLGKSKLVVTTLSLQRVLAQSQSLWNPCFGGQTFVDRHSVPFVVVIPRFS